MLPDKILIRREPGHWTEHIGRTSDRRQYVAMIGFLETQQRRLASVLHLFDEDGVHLSSKAWESDAEQNLERAIRSLPGAKGCNVSIRPFASRHFGDTTFGLVARDDGGAYVYEPFDLVFFPPWDGTHST